MSCELLEIPDKLAPNTVEKKKKLVVIYLDARASTEL